MKNIFKIIVVPLLLTFAQAVPFSCTTDAYIFSSPTYNTPTTVDSFDLTDGTKLFNKFNINPSNINAIGYNVVDNHIWGFDRGTYQVVRIDGNYQINAYTISGLPTFAPANDTFHPTYHSGDVSMGGILHLSTISDPNTLYRVDVNYLSANYLKTLPPVPLSAPIELSDFAFSPIDNLLYAVDWNETLIKIDQNSGTVTNLGKLVAMPDSGNVASVFFDKEGNLYAHHSLNANVYKINIATVTATYFSNIGTTNHGDGARCAHASLEPTYTINGSIFNDQNHNGTKESGENGLNTTNYVKLCKDDGTFIKSVQADITTGAYTLNAIADGNYTLIEDASNTPDCTTSTDVSGWISTTANTIDAIINGADVTNKDFGNFNGSTISGYVFDDTNQNGHFDTATEQGLANIGLLIKRCGQNEFDNTITDNQGRYTFWVPIGVQGDYSVDNWIGVFEKDSSGKISTDSGFKDDFISTGDEFNNGTGIQSEPTNGADSDNNWLCFHNITGLDFDNGGYKLVGNNFANATPKPLITMNNLSQFEGNNGTTDFNITIQSNIPAPVGGISIGYTTIAGTATEGIDTSSFVGYDPTNSDHLNYTNYFKTWWEFIVSWFIYEINFKTQYPTYYEYYTIELGKTPLNEGGVQKMTTPSIQKSTTPLTQQKTDSNTTLDYYTKEGVLIIKEGETSATLTLDIIGDTLVEKDETFSLKLIPSDTYVLEKEDINVTIVNDDANVSANLIAEYRFDECAWNGDAGEVKDSSGNGLDATAKNGATLTKGVINNAGKFDGNAYIDIPQNSELSLTKDMSLSFWVNPTEQAYSVANWQQNFIVKGFGTEFRVDFWYDGMEKCLCVAYTHGDNSQIVNPDNDKIYWDTWSHFTLVRDVTTKMVHFYIDGVLIDSKPYDTLGIGEPTSQLSGVTLSAGTNLSKFKGEIDEVKFFEGQLSPTQITDMYTHEKNGLNWDGTTREAVVCSSLMNPFTCDETLYLSNRNILGTGAVDGEKTWLHTIDRDTTPHTYKVIGGEYVSSKDGYNALGYNVKDNFMYALDGNMLLKIDSNATVEKLGVVAGLDPQQLYAGEFDRDGFFYVSGNGGNSSEMYKIDIHSNTIVKTITLSQSVRFWDMAIDETGAYFYVMLIADGDGDSDYNNDKFAKINIATGELTTIGNAHSDLTSYISLIFSDIEGKVFMMSNENGFYTVDTTTGEMYQIASTQDLTFYNDGTSCADANISEPPRVLINNLAPQKEGDSGLTPFTFTITLSKPATTDTGFWFTLTDGVNAVTPIHTAEQLPSDDDYRGDSGYITIPAGNTNIDITAYVVGDTKMEYNEEFYLDLYAPNNLILQDSRAVATIINDDVVLFNVERTNSDTVDNATQPQKESLYTQIVGRDFNYAVVAYDKNQTINAEALIEDITLKVELFDNNSTNKNNLLYSNYVYFPKGTPQSRLPVTPNTDLIIPKATRNARYQISYVLDGNGSIVYGQYDNEVEFNTTTSTFTPQSNGSRDNFAIRPASYRMTISDVDAVDDNDTNSTGVIAGKSMVVASTSLHTTSNDTAKNSMKLAAEHPYALSVFATQYASETLALDYTLNHTNELNATLIFKNKTMFPACDNVKNQDRNNAPVLRYLFDNGTLTGNTKLSHNNVGEYALHIRDINWTNIDQNSNPTLADCIANSAIISKDGDAKSGCNIESNLSDIMPSYSPAHHNIDVNFEAYKFDLSNMSLANLPNTGKNYIYMNDLHDNPNMGIRMAGDVVAQGEKGGKLTNYTCNCFAKEVNILIDHNITTDKGHFSNEAVTLETKKKTPLQSTFIIKNNGVASTATYQNLNDPIVLKKEDFLDTNKGSSNLEILYNIQKSYHEATNPVKIDFIALDANATDALSSVNNQDFTAQGTQSFNSTKYVYFTRIAPDKEVYDISYEKSVSTPVTIELFCEQNHTWCPEMLQSNGLNNNNSQIGWYTAQYHNLSTEGTINSFNPNNAQIKVTGVGNSKYGAGRFTNTRTSTTNHAMPTTPMHVQVDINATTWLNYHPTATNGVPFWKNRFEEMTPSAPSGIGLMGNRLDVELTTIPAHRAEW